MHVVGREIGGDKGGFCVCVSRDFKYSLVVFEADIVSAISSALLDY
jgi:hypothetical protein